MASPAELVRALPDTLPEDFSEWDGENSLAAPADEFSGFKCSNAFEADSDSPAHSPGQEMSELPTPESLHEELRDELQAEMRNEVRNEPTPAPPALSLDQQAFERSLRAISESVKSEPMSAEHGQAAAFASTPVGLPPIRTSPAADALRNPSLAPPAVSCADDQDFFNQLRTIGKVLNSQPINGSHKSVLSRAKEEVSFKPTPKPVPEDEIEPPSLRPVPSNGAAVRRWPTRPSREFVSLKLAPSNEPAERQSADLQSAERQSPDRQSADRESADRQPADRRSPVKPTPDEATLKAASSERLEEIWQPADSSQQTDTIGVTDGVDAPMFQSDLDELGEQDFNRRKWFKFGVFGFITVFLLAILGVRLLSPAKPASAKQIAEPQLMVVSDEETFSEPKPSPSTRMSPASRSTMAQSATATQPSASPGSSPPAPVDSQLMNEQLNAAPRIPQDIKKVQPKDDAAPPEDITKPSAVDGVDPAALKGVFNNQAHPTVTYGPTALVIIPAGVANGLLVQRTQPVYPSGAWYNGTTGKVVLQATVSKSGSVENVLFVSGSHIFRQAALDAVRSWRYRPYTVNNEPREFQTTVNVNFDQTSASNPLSILHLGSKSKKTTSSLQSGGAGAS